MVHLRASGSTGRSSSRKKMPRLVPPLIITVRILACILTSFYTPRSHGAARHVLICSFVQAILLVSGSTWRARSPVDRSVRHPVGMLPTRWPRPLPGSAWPRPVQLRWAQALDSSFLLVWDEYRACRQSRSDVRVL